MPPERIATSTLPLRNDVLLILLALRAEPLHGYALMDRIEAESDGAVIMQAGAFYRTLRNMLQDGLVEECEPAGDGPRDARTRRFYRLTRDGRAVTKAELARLEALVRRGRQQPAVKRSR